MGSRGAGRQWARIRVEGPLAPFADGARQAVVGLGYEETAVRTHMRLLAALSGWLESRGLGAAGLTDAAVEGFLRHRRAEGQRIGLTIVSVAPLLSYLRDLGAVPPAAPPPPTPLGLLLAEYRDYMEGERGMSASTVDHYQRYARRFLASLPEPAGPGLAELSAAQVVDFVRGWYEDRRGAPQDQMLLPALRSLLRFLHVTGKVPLPLVGAVPAGKHLPVRGSRRVVSDDDLRAVLEGCDRTTAAGRRDFAVLLMLVRLAVRGGEVAGLRLADVHWQAGKVTIRGKGGRVDTLPLPADVGEAMADYLLNARPPGRAPTLFLTVRAPFKPMEVSGVTQLVKSACRRAGVPAFSPHRVRHAVACGLLAAGASMEEIAQLLRHAEQRTTALYARIGQPRLAELALPCPQGAAL
jgi:site-specific recombinase XerD